MKEKMSVTFLIVEVDGDGVAVTWDQRVTPSAAGKVQKFIETLTDEEVDRS